MRYVSWHEAACRSYPPEMWEVAPSGRLSNRNYDAIYICNTCPIKKDCASQHPGVKAGSFIVAGRIKTPHASRPLSADEAERYMRRRLSVGDVTAQRVRNHVAS